MPSLEAPCYAASKREGIQNSLNQLRGSFYRTLKAKIEADIELPDVFQALITSGNILDSVTFPH